MRFLLDRLFQSILSLLAVTFIAFALLSFTGDPARFYVNEDYTQADLEQVRKRLGLDKPLPVQYGLWLGRVVQGDLGRSYHEHGTPVATLLRQRVGASFQLAAVAFVIIAVVAIPLGVLSAVKRGTVFDTLGKTLAILGQSVPQFWLGIVLIVLFGVFWQLLPITGRGGPSHYVLPGITAAWFGMAGLLRITRSSMLEVLHADYVRTAHAKGLSNGTVVWRHAFRNALIPIVTFAGLLLGGMLNGFVLIEVVFAWPGLGSATVEAAAGRDFAVIQGLILFIMTVYLLVNLTVDVLYGLIDPRLRFH